jgi:hypothetical protein
VIAPGLAQEITAPWESEAVGDAHSLQLCSNAEKLSGLLPKHTFRGLISRKTKGESVFKWKRADRDNVAADASAADIIPLGFPRPTMQTTPPFTPSLLRHTYLHPCRLPYSSEVTVHFDYLVNNVPS